MIKLYGGKQVPFELKDLPEKLGNITKIVTNENINVIYLFLPEQKKIVQIGKDGVYKKQYVIDTTETPLDIILHEDGSLLYVLTDKKVYALSLL